MDQPVIPGNEIAPRSFITNLLLCSSVAGSALFTIVYFTFSIMAPNYEAVRQSIGDLQLLPKGWIQSANFIMLGLFICAFAIGLRKEMAGGFGIVLIPAFHLLTGLGLIVAGIFIHNPLHLAGVITTFLALCTSFLLLAYRFSGDDRWRKWPLYTILTVVFMVLLLILFGYSKSHNGPYAGVFERLMVITRLTWSAFFTIKLLEGQRLTLIVYSPLKTEKPPKPEAVVVSQETASIKNAVTAD